MLIVKWILILVQEMWLCWLHVLRIRIKANTRLLFGSSLISMECDIFVWNCQGANDNNFRRTMRCFIKQYKPNVLVILETRISGIKADRVIKNMGFGRSHQIEAEGFSGGIWIMWTEEVAVLIRQNNLQFVHIEVSSPNRNQFMFTVVYGSPNFKERQTLWSKLKELEGYNCLPWLAARDLNVFLAIDEKKKRVLAEGQYLVENLKN